MILVAGSANLDFVVRADHIPQPGETVLGRQFETFPGGKGANQAVACARAGGTPTHMLAGLGQDAFANPLLESLRTAGVVVHEVRVSEPTGTAFICVADSGENAITVAPGANAALRPEHLPTLHGFTHLLMQLETPLPTITAYAQAARLAGLTVVLNAAPAAPLPSTLLNSLDILIVNEGELDAIAGTDGSIAEKLLRLTVPTVCVTLGPRGSVARSGDACFCAGAFPVQPVDTTGAGDTFCGALVASLSRAIPLGQSMRYANAAAALACTGMGAQSSIPQARDVEALLHQHPSDRTSVSDLRAYCGLPPI